MSAFRCPKCGAHTGVVDTRVIGEKRNSFIRRRRECTKRHRFTTYEMVANVKVYGWKGKGHAMMERNTQAHLVLAKVKDDFATVMELINEIAAKL